MRPALTIEPSATVTINSLALEKKQRGEKVFNLTAGEPMIPTPQVIMDAASQAMRDEKTHYPPVQGVPELLVASSQWMNTNYGTSYGKENTLVTCGGKFGIYALCQTLLEAGDEVLIPSPYWVSYPGIVKLFKGVPVVVPTSVEKQWKVTPEYLAKASTGKTKVLILNNASNPTGTVYTKDEIRGILEFAHKKDLTVISDEVYSELVYTGQPYISCGSFPEYADHVCVIQSCSKSFAMTGWRVGYTFAPPEIIKVLTMLQGQSTTGTSSISQWAAVTAFQNAPEINRYVRKAMQSRRDTFYTTLNKLFDQSITPPDSSLYAFIPLAVFGIEHNDSVKFCEDMLRNANVSAAPGKAFGQEGYLRFAFGEKEEELIGGLESLAQYLKEKR